MLKSQDINLLLKLAVIGDRRWSYAELAVELHMSQSQLHASVKRVVDGVRSGRAREREMAVMELKSRLEKYASNHKPQY